MSIQRFLFAALAAVILGGCENPAAETAAQETEPQAQETEEARETGRITLNFGIAGEPAPGEDNNGARTTGYSGSIEKCVVSFTPTGKGGSHADVEIKAPVSNTVSIDSFKAGTYTISVQAYAQRLISITPNEYEYVAYAVGGKTGVEVLAGENVLTEIFLGPDPQGEDGYFAYNLTIPAGAGGSLGITEYSGKAVEGGTISLEGGLNKGSLSLSPGYYRARVELSKGEHATGFTEMVHIYPGDYSALTWEYRAGDIPGSL
jgi:hypothetical protein